MDRCRVVRGQGNGAEGEVMARALGVRLPSFRPDESEVRPEIWERYRDRYPDDWILEPQYMVCPVSRSVNPQGIEGFNIETGKRRGMVATISDSSLDGCPDKPLTERARCYVENKVKFNNNNYAPYGYFTKQEVYRAEKRGCWGVVEISTPQQKFKDDVKHAKIRDERGLLLSDREIRSQAPATGWLSLFYGKGATAPQSEREGYHRGLVVKLTGDYDENIPHNNFAVITEVIDPWHFKVVTLDYEELVIRDTDIKGWIGDDTTDYAKFGEEWRRKELLPFIRKVMGRHPRGEERQAPPPGEPLPDWRQTRLTGQPD
jgi:hypothetical protein